MRQDRWETPALGPGLGVVGWTPVGWDCSESGPWGHSGGHREASASSLLGHDWTQAQCPLGKGSSHAEAAWRGSRGFRRATKRRRSLGGQEGVVFSYDNKCHEVKEETQQENAPHCLRPKSRGCKPPESQGRGAVTRCAAWLRKVEHGATSVPSQLRCPHEDHVHRKGPRQQVWLVHALHLLGGDL